MNFGATRAQRRPHRQAVAVEQVPYGRKGGGDGCGDGGGDGSGGVCGGVGCGGSGGAGGGSRDWNGIVMLW